MTIAARPLELVRESFLERAAVVQARQRVGLGLVLQVLLVLDDSRSDANPRQQFGKRKWLRDIVVCPRVESADPVPFLD